MTWGGLLQIKELAASHGTREPIWGNSWAPTFTPYVRTHFLKFMSAYQGMGPVHNTREPILGILWAPAKEWGLRTIRMDPFAEVFG